MPNLNLRERLIDPRSPRHPVPTSVSMTRVWSATVVGVTGVPVEVEVRISSQLPCVDVVGLPEGQPRDSVRDAAHTLRSGPTAITSRWYGPGSAAWLWGAFESEDAARRGLPFFVAQRTTVIRVNDVVIP